MPDVFGLADPGTLESSTEMQAPHRAVLLNCDSQHSVPGIRTSESHERGQVLKSCNQLMANEFSAQQAHGVRMHLPDSGYSASNRAARDRESRTVSAKNRRSRQKSTASGPVPSPSNSCGGGIIPVATMLVAAERLEEGCAKQSFARRYESLIRLADAIRSQHDLEDLFQILSAEL